MATYLELANLANDSSFLLRIGYAIGKYAAYIFNESGGTTNHTERRNWALNATANIPLMQSLLVHEICRDSNVVAGLEAVSDVNLQTATETAANNR
ncbi:MAG: hypothetical protein NTW28_30945, partial [Candidatus Solibacter sp.]|nr:hypothetical protein [Candidatus Solibacter sp.]